MAVNETGGVRMQRSPSGGDGTTVSSKGEPTT